MNESFERFERKITEEEVIVALDETGIENEETKELLGKYADQVHSEADAAAAANPENKAVSNAANIRADLKIALLYAKTTRYKTQAIESLEEALLAASQNDDTAELAAEIEVHIVRLSSK